MKKKLKWMKKELNWILRKTWRVITGKEWLSIHKDSKDKEFYYELMIFPFRKRKDFKFFIGWLPEWTQKDWELDREIASKQFYFTLYIPYILSMHIGKFRHYFADL